MLDWDCQTLVKRVVFMSKETLAIFLSTILFYHFDFVSFLQATPRISYSALPKERKEEMRFLAKEMYA